MFSALSIILGAMQNIKYHFIVVNRTMTHRQLQFICYTYTLHTHIEQTNTNRVYNQNAQINGTSMLFIER